MTLMTDTLPWLLVGLLAVGVLALLGRPLKHLLRLCLRTGVGLAALNVDGGASANDFLKQIQCDMLRCTLRRPACTESTALGAAFLAGLAIGFWKDKDELRRLRRDDDVYNPMLEDERHARLVLGWEEAVRRTMTTEKGRSW